MRRLRAFLLTLVLVMLCALGFGGIDTRAETAKKSTENIMSYISGSKTAIKKYWLSAVDKKGYGGVYDDPTLKLVPSMKAYIKKYNAKMTYKVKSVKTSGKQAVVKMRVRSADSGKLNKYFNERFQEKLNGLTQEEIQSRMQRDGVDPNDPEAVFTYMLMLEFQCMQEAFEEAEAKYPNPVMKTKTYTLRLQKSGQRWKICQVSQYNKTLPKLLYAGLVQEAGASNDTGNTVAASAFGS